MNIEHKLSNQKQFGLLVLLGAVVIPLFGIVPALMPYFVDNFPRDALVRNPLFRILAPIASVSLGLFVLWFLFRRIPIHVTLKETVEIKYALHAVSHAYDEITSASIENREIKTRPLPVNETIFTMEFKNGDRIKISMNPSKNADFLEALSKRLPATG